MYQRSTVYTVNDIRAIAKAIPERHFFDRDTMRFFNSRILSGIVALDTHEAIPGNRFLFVTSEVPWDSAREYTVRIVTLTTTDDGAPSYDIDSITTRDTAHSARRAMHWLADRPACDSCGSLSVVDVWCGYDKPAYACEHCAEYRIEKVIAGANARGVN